MSDNQQRGTWTSASNALADSLCPGRHLAQVGLPEESGEYAELGRRIHKALADGTNRAFIQTLELDERETFEACRELEQQLIAEFFRDFKNNGGATDPNLRWRAFREERYWVRFVGTDGKKLEHSGQPDVVFRGGTRALVIEYKTLRGDVPASPKNLQLRDQAVLVKGQFMLVNEVGVAVVQPLVTRKPEICLYNTDDLARAAAELFMRIEASNNPLSRRVAGEVQCQWCRAKRQCAEYQQWAGQMTPPAMLNLLSVPLSAWTPEQRASAANALSPAQKFLDELKEYLKAGLSTDPAFVPGWTLSEGQKRDTITEPQTCFDRFVKLGGNAEQFMGAVTIGKTRLREQVHKLSGLKGKGLDEVMRAMTDGIVETKQTAQSLKKVEEKP